ncbi:MAG: hypothetical protein ACLRQF_15090 [Thomasclavelia ramosa]
MGKLLGELGAAYLGFNASSFSYGSEKRGSPVKAFIRYCDEDKEITVNTRYATPFAGFHEAMIGKLQVMRESMKIVVLSSTAVSNQM